MIGPPIYIGLCIGIKIGKCMVSTLEEYEIFVLDEEEEDWPGKGKEIVVNLDDKI